MVTTLSSSTRYSTLECETHCDIKKRCGGCLFVFLSCYLSYCLSWLLKTTAQFQHTEFAARSGRFGSRLLFLVITTARAA